MIKKFKDKNIEYLQKLNELIHNNFNPFAKNIIENARQFVKDYLNFNIVNANLIEQMNQLL